MFCYCKAVSREKNYHTPVTDNTTTEKKPRSLSELQVLVPFPKENRNIKKRPWRGNLNF